MRQGTYFKMKNQCEILDILETYSVVFTGVVAVVVIVFTDSLILHLFHMHFSLVIFGTKYSRMDQV